jgi:hypothetical protein
MPTKLGSQRLAGLLLILVVLVRRRFVTNVDFLMHYRFATKFQKIIKPLFEFPSIEVLPESRVFREHLIYLWTTTCSGVTR